MKLEFSNEQVQVLYELIGKSQIQGQAAKTIVGLQQVIEKAFQAEQGTLTPEVEAEKVEPKKK